MKITGKRAVIKATPIEVFNFLADPNNIELLLPADRISDFKIQENGCSFKVQGGILIPLIYIEKVEPTTIRLNDGGSGPFPYEMTINIAPGGENESVGNIVFEGQINMFMKMMVEKPLTSLFESMTNQLQMQFG